MISPETHVANEIRNERVRDSLRAYHDRQLVALAIEDRPARRWIVRRPSARILAAVSRGTAGIAGWLDECVGEDLGRQLFSNRLGTPAWSVPERADASPRRWRRSPISRTRTPSRAAEFKCQPWRPRGSVDDEFTQNHGSKQRFRPLPCAADATSAPVGPDGLAARRRYGSRGLEPGPM